MNRGISNNQAERCARCGGKTPHATQRQARADRPCNCWDPLVEWLMDRNEKPA
jgi:hypothetical protein